MTGEMELSALLAGMQPALSEEVYVFCSLSEVPALGCHSDRRGHSASRKA
jgi:hypothetical protein